MIGPELSGKAIFSKNLPLSANMIATLKRYMLYIYIVY
jgi:hypothetical protein